MTILFVDAIIGSIFPTVYFPPLKVNVSVSPSYSGGTPPVPLYLSCSGLPVKILSSPIIVPLFANEAALNIRSPPSFSTSIIPDGFTFRSPPSATERFPPAVIFKLQFAATVKLEPSCTSKLSVAFNVKSLVKVCDP